MTRHERIKIVIKWLIGNGVAPNQAEIGKLIGYSNASAFSKVLNQKVPIPEGFLTKLSNLDIRLNKVWIEEGWGNMIEAPDEAKSYEIPEGIIKAPLIGQYANGGYLRGYADPDYLGEQPIFFSTRSHSGGNYVAFEVKGDSMNDGSVNAICEGDILLGRELIQEHWTARLHIPKVFIIVHKVHGICVKEITEHDVETGRIVCHSWNPDPEYQDFDCNLKDIAQLFYIKEISRNFKL